MAIVSIGTQTTTEGLLRLGTVPRFIIGNDSSPAALINLVTNSKTVFARNNSGMSLVVGPASRDDVYIEKGLLQPAKTIEIELFGDIYSNSITPPVYQFWS